MPVAVTLTRPTLTDNDSLNAAAFNAVTVSSALVPDAAAGTEGVIRLAGDLTGSAAAPALATSGVAAGSYGAAGANVPNITVDAKGRVTSAANRAIAAADIGAAASAHTHAHTDISGLGDAATKNTGTTAGTVAAGDDARMTNSRQCNNSFDNATTARSNLGLGDSATRAVGTTAGTVAAGDDSRITGAAQKASNLSDLANAATARTNLGLNDAATKAVGTTAGTVAAGDDSRITGAAQKSSNLSDLANAATARTNLGIGSMATRAVTISTSDPSGGSDGDVWLKYTP